ncbi:MAG TPA: GAF domain-containing protein, partial [Phenylobacterium sp.]
PAGWPAALRNAAALVMQSAFPMFLIWGQDRLLIYNAAYAPILGDRHPHALGGRFWEVWPEVRSQIEPIIEGAFLGRESYFEDLEVSLLRDGRAEPAWFTFAYSPVYDDGNAVPGVLCVCNETSAIVRNARRLRFLDKLATAVAALSDADAIMAATTRLTGEHLGVSVCAYADMDDDEDGFTIRGDWSAPGSDSIVGRYRLADFGKLAVSNLSAGRPLVVNNNLVELAPEEAATFQSIGITATICMPLVRNGRLRALMAVHHKGEHAWTADELALIREVTERSWAHVERVGAEADLRASEEQLRLATEAAEVGQWDVDPLTDTLFWPPRVKAMFGISADAPVSMSEDFFPCLHPEDADKVGEAYAAATDPDLRALYDVEYRTVGKEDGVVRWVAAKGRGLFDERGRCHRVIGTAIDVTARKEAERAALEQAHSLEVLNATGAALAAELDLEKIVQQVTDAGVRITGAQFGAFFYNLTNEAGQSYTLYSLAGVDRSNFDKFPMPRNTAVFAPTFVGEGVVRSDDITADPRYGKSAPHYGMPAGHLPVRSYLAVPVVSRSGEVLGGLFFGHERPGVFSEGAERLVRGVAGQAAVAIDNARLYQDAQRELARRRKVEEQQTLLINELNHRVKNTLATVQSIVAQTSKQGGSPEIRQAIEGRLLALAGAHDLLTRRNWEGADLRDLIERALAPFAVGDHRLVLAGPALTLAPQKALAMAMTMHELATNAVKYGALSTPAGRVEITWEVAEDRLSLQWAEHGGPPVSPPPARGFGSRLLERGLAGDLKGSVELRFPPEGVRCLIEAALDRAPAWTAPELNEGVALRV